MDEAEAFPANLEGPSKRGGLYGLIKSYNG